MLANELHKKRINDITFPSQFRILTKNDKHDDGLIVYHRLKVAWWSGDSGVGLVISTLRVRFTCAAGLVLGWVAVCGRVDHLGM